MKQKNKSRIVIQVCLALFFILVVIAPIITMFTRINAESIRNVVTDANFAPAVLNSITTSLTATVISVVLALLASFSLYRTSMRGKNIFAILFVLPMLIPSISHAYGLRALIGKNGYGVLAFILGKKASIFGFWGIVAGSVLYSFPVAFLMLQSILRYEDGMQYKAAKVLGIPAHRRFFGITLPYMRKTLISMFFAVFTMIITDYGVPEALYSNKFGYTLSMLLLRNYKDPQRGVGAAGVIGVLLLIPAVAAFAVDMFVPELNQSSFVSEPVEESRNRALKISAYVFCIILSVAIFLPIIAFIIQLFSAAYPWDKSFTFDHIISTVKSGADKFLLYSLLYSAIAAVLGTVLAFIRSYMTTRAKGRVISKALHLISITSVAIPGLVFGLAYIIFFKSTVLYGTVIIIGLANTVHFFVSPYLMMYNTLGKVNADLEDVGKTLGIRRIRIVTDVIIPKVRFTMFEMAVYFFVNSMMTISAVSLLAPPSPQPLSLMIAQATDQVEIGKAATVSFMILIVNFIIKLTITLINRHKEKKQGAVVVD